MASLQTRLSQGAARDADREWKQHQGLCPRCSRIGHDKSAAPCLTGHGLRAEAAKLRAEAREEAGLDKAPAPGQSALF